MRCGCSRSSMTAGEAVDFRAAFVKILYARALLDRRANVRQKHIFQKLLKYTQIC